MKKVLFFLMMFLCASISKAQGVWEKRTVEGDELKGTKSHDVYIFTDENVGSFVFFGPDTYMFRLTSDKEQFDINSGYSSYTGPYAFVTTLVGIYDDNGSLLEKFEMNLDREDNKANHFLVATTSRIGHKKKMKKMFEAILSSKGYIRIVAPRYNSTDFDLKILPYAE